MSLQQKLDAIRKGFEAQAPAEALEVMHRATDDLRASGILDRVAKEGETVRPFELADTRGETVRSQDLLARGPLVLTFFRGRW
jgi:hypothetical protein